MKSNRLFTDGHANPVLSSQTTSPDNGLPYVKRSKPMIVTQKHGVDSRRQAP